MRLTYEQQLAFGKLCESLSKEELLKLNYVLEHTKVDNYDVFLITTDLDKVELPETYSESIFLHDIIQTVLNEQMGPWAKHITVSGMSDIHKQVMNMNMDTTGITDTATLKEAIKKTIEENFTTGELNIPTQGLSPVPASKNPSMLGHGTPYATQRLTYTTLPSRGNVPGMTDPDEQLKASLESHPMVAQIKYFTANDPLTLIPIGNTNAMNDVLSNFFKNPDDREGEPLEDDRYQPKVSAPLIDYTDFEPESDEFDHGDGYGDDDSDGEEDVEDGF